MSNQYADRDTESLGEYYIRNVEAMTSEGLHDKNKIAAELAFRDRRIDELKYVISEAINHLEFVKDENDEGGQKALVKELTLQLNSPGNGLLGLKE